MKEVLTSPGFQKTVGGLSTLALSYYLARKGYHFIAKDIRKGKPHPDREYSKTIPAVVGLFGSAFLTRDPRLALGALTLGGLIGSMRGVPEVTKSIKYRQKKAASAAIPFLAAVGLAAGGYFTGRYMGKRMTESYFAKHGIKGARARRVNILAWPFAILTMPWSLWGAAHGIHDAVGKYYDKYVK